MRHLLKHIVFLKIPTLLEAEAAIALTCFSNVTQDIQLKKTSPQQYHL